MKMWIPGTDSMEALGNWYLGYFYQINQWVASLLMFTTIQLQRFLTATPTFKLAMHHRRNIQLSIIVRIHKRKTINVRGE